MTVVIVYTLWSHDGPTEGRKGTIDGTREPMSTSNESGFMLHLYREVLGHWVSLERRLWWPWFVVAACAMDSVHKPRDRQLVSLLQQDRR